MSGSRDSACVSRTSPISRQELLGMLPQSLVDQLASADLVDGACHEMARLLGACRLRYVGDAAALDVFLDHVQRAPEIGSPVGFATRCQEPARFDGASAIRPTLDHC